MKFIALSLSALVAVNAQAGRPKGNCKSGPLVFDINRVAENGGELPLEATVPASLDVNKFDLIVGKDKSQIRPFGKGGFSLVMKPGNGAKVSTTRYHLYGKFSVKFTAVGPGFVTDMITMSEVQDEIDWETTGPTPHAENNVFYHVKGKKAGSPESESGVHGGTAVPGGSIPIDNGPHTYEIDWKRTSITWSLDGKVVRTLNKAESFSKLNPKQTWFPDTPSILQFAVWQADGSPGWAGVPNWAGQTEKLANFENVNIQCYDESDKPVPFFPLDQKIINVVSNVTDSTTAVDSKTTGATGVATVTLGGGAAATGTAKPSQATATNAPSSANAVVSGLTSLLVSSALFALL